MFSDWEKKSKEAKLSTALLWDYDLADFDW